MESLKSNIQGPLVIYFKTNVLSQAETYHPEQCSFHSLCHTMLYTCHNAILHTATAWKLCTEQSGSWTVGKWNCIKSKSAVPEDDPASVVEMSQYLFLLFWVEQ